MVFKWQFVNQILKLLSQQSSYELSRYYLSGVCQILNLSVNLSAGVVYRPDF